MGGTNQLLATLLSGSRGHSHLPSQERSGLLGNWSYPYIGTIAQMDEVNSLA
jgi:hypothetical protein